MKKLALASTLVAAAACLSSLGTGRGGGALLSDGTPEIMNDPSPAVLDNTLASYAPPYDPAEAYTNPGKAGLLLQPIFASAAPASPGRTGTSGMQGLRAGASMARRTRYLHPHASCRAARPETRRISPDVADGAGHSGCGRPGLSAPGEVMHLNVWWLAAPVWALAAMLASPPVRAHEVLESEVSTAITAALKKSDPFEKWKGVTWSDWRTGAIPDIQSTSSAILQTPGEQVWG